MVTAVRKVEPCLVLTLAGRKGRKDRAVRRRAKKSGGRQIEVTIETLGGRGDGVAYHQGRPVFVPQALPGERLQVRLVGKAAGGERAEPLELLEAAANRREPPCPNFGRCGGCALQHLDEDDYRRWKREQVVQALARRGLPVDSVREIIAIPGATRRRASLVAIRKDGRVRLGFHERQSHRIADIEGCLILTPSLMALLPALTEGLSQILAERDEIGLSVTETEGGPDAVLSARRGPTLRDREVLAALAETAQLARLHWIGPDGEPEPLALRRPALVLMAGVPVEIPPSGFLQSSREGEAALADLVLNGLSPAPGGVLELYAGCGSFTFAMAKGSRVHAVEGDEAALAALSKAARQAGLSNKIETETRDLARRPILAKDMADYDAVVFDPPREGAKEPAAEIARADLSRVVAVSCNPRSFARDARLLVDGGFALTEVTPVDQFIWSSHVELVAVFER